jgi:hypothetical protein
MAGLLLIFVAVFLLSAGPVAVAQPAEPKTDLDDSGKPGLEGGAISDPPIFLSPITGGLSDGPSLESPAAGPLINVWYGHSPRFGHHGDPQKWVNIPGNVSAAAGLAGLTYRVGNGPAIPLSLGPDTLRLAQAGDFNIELDYTDLLPGMNPVTITAIDTGGASTQVVVNVDYRGGGLTWAPGTYLYDWSTANRIDDIAQVVDGQWIIDNGSLRPTVLAFDRLIGLGDLTWRDYTVTVPITFYGIDAGGYKAPSNGPGVGIMVRWAGHYDNNDGITPVHGWRRLGAIGWYRWQRKDGVYSEGLQLLGHKGRVLDTNPKQLTAGVTYYFKLDIQSPALTTGRATYRFKVWPVTETEPATWDIEKLNISGEPSGGSVLLIAHHVDARFGPVRVDLRTVRPPPTLNVSTAGSGSGQVSRQPPGPIYRFGEDVVLSALPDGGSLFAGWSGGLTGSDNPAGLSLFESAAVTATFNSGTNHPTATASHTPPPTNACSLTDPYPHGNHDTYLRPRFMRAPVAG